MNRDKKICSIQHGTRTGARHVTAMIVVFMSLFCMSAHAQELALKTNLVADVTGTIDLGAEYALGSHQTVALTADYNPFSYGKNKQMKAFAIRPEWRFWLYEPYYGWYAGVHFLFADYDVRGIGPFNTLKNNRVDGNFIGGGIGVGYNLPIGDLWNLDFGVAVSAGQFKYKRSALEENPDIVSAKASYIGPTLINVSLVYFLW